MDVIKKVLHDVEVEFYQKENGKYTCRVKNDPEATKSLLDSCKTKAVSAERLHFFIKGTAEKIESGALRVERQEQTITDNPIIVLSELVQRRFGQNLEARVIGKRGQDHCPTISVSIVLPDGTEQTASGCNQKEAKQKAAKKLLGAVFGIKTNK